MKLHHAGCAMLIGATLVLSGCSGDSSSSAPSAEAKITPSKKAQASDYNDAVQELYIAYFGRPADPGGLTNFENALLRAGAPTTLAGLNSAYGTNSAVKTLVDSFGTSAESIALYGSGSTTAFVTAIYQNVLSRAPDSGGLAYWQSAIDNAGLTKGNAALSIMAGALTNTTVQGELDGELVVNKVAVAGEFSIAAAADNNVYSGNDAAASARTMLGTVTSTTVPTAFQATITSTLTAIAAQAEANATYTVTTLLAAGGFGNNPTGNTTNFIKPTGIATDSAGNIYVADTGETVIRKITPAGVVTILAGTSGISGSADGTGTAASFAAPAAIAVDSAGNLYVADELNSNIRKITPAGVVTTLAGTARVEGYADGTGAAAKFVFPDGIAVDSAGNVYVTDNGNAVIRKITPAGVVTTLAGAAGIEGAADGVGTAARFYYPNGIAIDSLGNLYVTDSGNQNIREITPAGVVTTFAGSAGVSAGSSGSTDGTGTAARFFAPFGLTVDNAGNIFVADSGNSVIRKITSAGVVTTVAGNIEIPGSINGVGVAARFFLPKGVTTDNAGNMYVADTSNRLIRKITY